MSTVKQYKHIRIEGSRQALTISFIHSHIFAADEIQGIGRELLAAADLAARIDMPLWLSFQDVHEISSALVGKIVLLKRKTKSVGIQFRIVDVPPPFEDLFRKLL